jgi:cell division protein FtsZ
MSFELIETEIPRAKIRVIGVGGGGGNAINSMIQHGLTGVEFAVINTDTQDLERSLTPNRIQLSTDGSGNSSRGLGTGGRHELGRDIALENRELLRSVLEGADMVFLTAGMGGGTGTGVTPVLAELAREMGILTVGIITRPFLFEGQRRRKTAEKGVETMKHCVDTLIAISNQRLLAAFQNIALKDAFVEVDNVLYQAVRGVSDLINMSGYVNVDFADVQSIMSGKGMGIMGVGIGEGSRAVIEAAEAAVNSPLLNEMSMTGARNILINIRGSESLGIHAIDEANRAISEAADPDANIIIGLIEDPTMGNTVQITVIATDFEDASTKYTANIERRVVGGFMQESPDNDNTNNSSDRPNMTGINTKAPLLNNSRSSWMMEEFHLPRFRK